MCVRVHYTENPRFLLNGLRHANEVLGEEAFNVEDWAVIGEYVYDAEGGRHQAFYAPKRDITVMGEALKAGERVQVEQSLKYSAEERERLGSFAGLVEIERWMTDDEDYGEWFFPFLAPTSSASDPVTRQNPLPLKAPMHEHLSKATPRFWRYVIPLSASPSRE